MLRHFPGTAVFFSSAAVRPFQIAMPPTAWANVIFLHKSLLLFFRYLDYIIAKKKIVKVPNIIFIRKYPFSRSPCLGSIPSCNGAIFLSCISSYCVMYNSSFALRNIHPYKSFASPTIRSTHRSFFLLFHRFYHFIICLNHERCSDRKRHKLCNWKCPPDHKRRIFKLGKQPCQRQYDNAQPKQGYNQ